MKASIQERILFIPLHHLTFHNQIPKRQVFYEFVEDVGKANRLKNPTLLIAKEKEQINLFLDKENIVKLVQDPSFVGLILCTNEEITISDEVIELLTKFQVPVIQINNYSSLNFFSLSDDSFYYYNQLGVELEQIDRKDLHAIVRRLSKIIDTPFLFLDCNYLANWRGKIIKQIN